MTTLLQILELFRLLSHKQRQAFHIEEANHLLRENQKFKKTMGKLNPDDIQQLICETYIHHITTSTESTLKLTNIKTLLMCAENKLNRSERCIGEMEHQSSTLKALENIFYLLKSNRVTGNSIIAILSFLKPKATYGRNIKPNNPSGQPISTKNARIS